VHAPTFLADAGVPMLFLAFPAAFYLLIPVIVVEFVVSRTLTDLNSVRRLGGVAAANVVSTLAGWPLMWFVLVALQLFVIPGGGGAYGLFTPLRAIASVTLQAAWLVPYEEELYWMVPTAAMVLMVPAFFVSVPIERAILHFIWRKEPVPQRRRFVWRANLCSYALLLAIGCSWLVYSIVDHRRHPLLPMREGRVIADAIHEHDPSVHVDWTTDDHGHPNLVIHNVFDTEKQDEVIAWAKAAKAQGRVHRHIVIDFQKEIPHSSQPDIILREVAF
jgi:hypothetical protein